jgi:hypothetical protein
VMPSEYAGTDDGCAQRALGGNLLDFQNGMPLTRLGFTKNSMRGKGVIRHS